MYSLPLLEGWKYSFVKTNGCLIKNTELFLSVCTDTVGQFCTFAILQTMFWDIFAAGEVCVNILDCFMSRTVLSDIWCLTFFVLQSFLRKKKNIKLIQAVLNMQNSQTLK